MVRPSRRHVRAFFAVVLVLSAGALAWSYATAAPNLAATHGATGDSASPVAPGAPMASGSATAGGRADGEAGTGDETVSGVSPGRAGDDARVDPAAINASWAAPGNLTVVSTQGFHVSDERAELVAFSPSGDVVYYDDAYRTYFDVDPVAGTRYTVEYVASRNLRGEACAESARCTYNVVRRVNLSTGVDREVYGEVTPRLRSTRWHDVDRIDETHLAVADIHGDSVRVVDATNGRTVWTWNASSHFDPDVGGSAGDWTHLNDVEVLDDGRLMASVRNMDRVVFLDVGASVDGNRTTDGGGDGNRTTDDAVDENWTLGAEDDYDVLYEQHNPDYVPAERGGPAVVVADSENGRVLEYRRVDPETGEATTAPDGVWRRSWGWRDARLQWPRDADRLPGGTTLVTDSHGDRVAEVEPDGSVAWSARIGLPYEAERLGTGDESAAGPSVAAMRASGDWSNASVPTSGTMTAPHRRPVDAFWLALEDLTPSLVVNGLLFASPSWIRFPDLVFAFASLLSALTWGAAELRWSPYEPLNRLRSGISRRR